MHHNPWLPRAHQVDYEHRSKVAPNHTMTHVLNWALREARVGTRWNWRKMRWNWWIGVLLRNGTAIRDQFKNKIRNRTTALRKGPPINIEPGSGGWARSTRFFGHSWQAGGTAGIGWADPKRTWQSKRGILCKELAWWSLEGVRLVQNLQQT